MGGVAFLLAGVFSFVWAGASTLYTLTARPKAIVIVREALHDPTATEVAKARALPPSPYVSVDRDLVSFSVPRDVVVDVNAANQLAEARAQELYDKGFPPDPGEKATRTQLPRRVLALFSRDRHDRLRLARNAALVGAATAMLMCAVIATGAARFALPGAGTALGYVLLRYHVTLFNFWIDRHAPGGQLYRGQLQIASTQPAKNLVFVSIALIVAGLVYSALLGGTKTVARERRRRRTKQQAPAAAPAPEPAPTPAADSATAPAADELQG